MANTRDERIAPTAYYTAYVWYRLGLPHAELFATPEGRRLFWGFRLAGEWIAAASPHVASMVQYLERRHRLIDRALVDLRPDRVVEIGAGLSRRGVTLARRGVDCVEVDLPHMIREKSRRIEAGAEKALRDALRERLRLVPMDVLSGAFEPFLVSALAGAKRPVVVAEGLLGYFPMSERAALSGVVAAALRAAGGGAFLCDLRTGERGRAARTQSSLLHLGIRAATRGRGAREDFASDAAVARFFEAAGFDETCVEDASSLPGLGHLETPNAVFRAMVHAGPGRA
jgi:O-methyltransferase involved in polyketide biosynthesis